MTMRVPDPRRASIFTSAPWRSATSFTIASPSPAPSPAEPSIRRIARTRASWAHAGMPGRHPRRQGKARRPVPATNGDAAAWRRIAQRIVDQVCRELRRPATRRRLPRCPEARNRGRCRARFARGTQCAAASAIAGRLHGAGVSGSVGARFRLGKGTRSWLADGPRAASLACMPSISRRRRG